MIHSSVPPRQLVLVSGICRCDVPGHEDHRFESTDVRGAPLPPLPGWVRRDEGLGTADDAAGLIVFLASDAARDITGQAIGVGGDRLALWAHPQEKSVAFAAGGWSAPAIAKAWPDGIGAEPETYGIPAPKSPES